jgi:hypothetical protein
MDLIRRAVRATCWMAVGLCPVVAPARLIINEVYYNITPQGGNQYVELYNSGATNCYLDGLILTDEADVGLEGVFQFPGAPGGTSYAVSPGGYVVIAVDATNNTSTADWECYAGVSDTDNPGVPNLTLVGGLVDLSLYPAGDNIILADGTSTSAPIAQASVIDGMNFAGGNGELAPLSASLPDLAPTAVASVSNALARCPNGVDADVSSLVDFAAGTPTPGAGSTCTLPTLSVDSLTLAEGDSGTSNAVFTVTLSVTSAVTVTVDFLTSNGTAVAAGDYVATNGTLSFTSGVTTRTVTVSVVGDTTPESTEQFYLVLQNPILASVLVPVGTGTITDLDVSFTSAFTQVAGPVGAITTLWTSVSGKTYQVQATTTMLTPLWTNVSGIVTATAASSTVVDTDGTATQRFYRVLHLD